MADRGPIASLPPPSTMRRIDIRVDKWADQLDLRILRECRRKLYGDQCRRQFTHEERDESQCGFCDPDERVAVEICRADFLRSQRWPFGDVDAFVFV